MTLQEDLEAIAAAVGGLESANESKTQTILAQATTIDEQAKTIAALKAQLEGSPPPGPQPNEGHYVALGDDVNAAIRQHPAGSVFAIEPGNRPLAEPLVRKKGNRLWSTPGESMFVGPGAGGVPFLPVDVDGLILQGIGARDFGPATTDAGAGMIDHDGGTDLRLEDCDFGYSNRSILSGHGSYEMLRTHLHHGGKYACQGAMGLIEDCEWSYSGRADIPGVEPWTTSDKGGCKFVKSKGMRIVGLHTHHHGGTGLWWDIQNEDAYAEDVVSTDNARHGISIEVSYGPFHLVRPVVHRCGTVKGAKETSVPVPAGILVSMTPDVVADDATVEDCWNGLVVRQWNHPQVAGTVGNADKSRLGVENVIFNGGRVTRSKQFDAGLHGPEVAGTRPTRNIHWNGVAFDADASFSSPLHIS